MHAAGYWLFVLGPSVKAKRDRQNLINKPQADLEPERDTDVQLQDVEPSTESMLSHSDASADNFTVTCENQRNNAPSNEASYSLTEESHLRIDKRKNRSPIATVSDTNSQNHLLMDVCNMMESFVVSDQPLPRKLCSRPPKAKTLECPSLPPLSSQHKTSSKQPLSKQLTSDTVSRMEDRCGVSLRSNFVGDTRKTSLYLYERRSVQDDECSAVGNSSYAATVCQSNSGLKTAISTAASHVQSVSHSVDKQAAGSSVTLGSVMDAAVHQTETPVCKIAQPNVAATRQQSRVRFEGNHRLLLMPVIAHADGSRVVVGRLIAYMTLSVCLYVCGVCPYVTVH